ncbi:MAG: hypothetical protein MUC91_06790, partial [Verrucomicrobia bacterium]|nr:hypothetical protein [Verrucomicrobiota bacterium]
MFYCPRLNIALTRLFPIIGFQTITELSSPEDFPRLGESSYLIDFSSLTGFSRIATTIVKYLSERNAVGVEARRRISCRHCCICGVSSGPRLNGDAVREQGKKLEPGTRFQAGGLARHPVLFIPEATPLTVSDSKRR